MRSAPLLRYGDNLRARLSEVGVSVDQRLARAITLASHVTSWRGVDKTDWVLQHEARILAALLTTNPPFAHHLLGLEPDGDTLVALRNAFVHHTQRDDYRIEGSTERVIFNSALASLGERTVLGADDFLGAVLESALRDADNYAARPFSVDLLCQIHGHDGTTPATEIPELQRALTAIRHRKRLGLAASDIQFVVGLQGSEIYFSAVSHLADVVHVTDLGSQQPVRVVLRHFAEQFCGFSDEDIRGLEALLNSPRSTERDFQSFFETHRHFLQFGGHREIYSQVVLERPEGNLVPDFIVTDRDLQRAAVVELKLPRPRLIRRDQNRDRFAAAVMSARAQLLGYRDWFRERANRERLRDVVRMSIYEPAMVVIIGRSAEFRDEIDRQTLRSQWPDVDVVTYDDLVRFAQRRRVVIR